MLNARHVSSQGGFLMFLSLILSWTVIITFAGATKSVYAPEPFDVGKILQADVILDDHRITLTTTGPIDPGSLRIICV